MTNDELIAQLCVRIGMIMEDVCDEAVMARVDGGEPVHSLVGRLHDASERNSALVHPAQVLADYD